MLFSEPAFFVFFAVYFVLHLLVPARWRLYLIVAGSTVFYGWWRIDYVWLPYALTLIAWTGAVWTGRAPEPCGKRRRLALTLIVLFAPLAIIKYARFLYDSLTGIAPAIGTMFGPDAVPEFALPLGISFVTFTLTAYVVDVYRGTFPADARLDRVLGYVLFFPHLIAGPILRPHELLPQLSRFRSALSAPFLLGVSVFTLGLVKKVVFADTLAAVVDPVFASGSQADALEYLLAIYGFSLQIYCDFSGYTDMAIGIAYILGIRLPTNFLRPYAAGSIIDFWHRWHITLSHWLRDYLYIPLGGNRLGENRRMLNLMTTMILGGLWHGAAWTFVIWGFLHGAALVVAHWWRRFSLPAGIALPNWIVVLVTFHFVTAAWVFFRAPDLQVALAVFQGPFTAPMPDPSSFLTAYLFEIVLLAVFLATHRFDQHARIRLAIRKYSLSFIVPVLVLCWTLAITISQGSSGKFIYFDF